MKEFTIAGRHNTATKWNVVLTNGETTHVLTTSERKTKGVLVNTLYAKGEFICELFPEDFEFEYKTATKAIHFSGGSADGYFIKYEIN